MVGAPACGKSTLARAVAQRVPAIVLQSDAVRKELFTLPRYTPAEHRRVFAVVQRRVQRALLAGRGVVLDATNLEERHRRVFYRLAATAGVPMLVVRLAIPEGEALRRLDARRRLRDPTDLSDADVGVYRTLAPRLEPIGRPHWVLNGMARPVLLADLVVRQLVSARVAGRATRSLATESRLPDHTIGGMRNVEARC